jgi:hypothetical protein
MSNEPINTDELVQTVSSNVLGIEMAIDRFNISEDAINEIMLDNGYEKCPSCEWYVETYELYDDEDELDGCCWNCR